MSAIGGVLKMIGYVVWFGAGLWGFVLCLGVVCDAAGFWGLVAALILCPVTFLAAPLYAGFALGNWSPLILNYGGGIVAAVLIVTGNAMRKEKV
ncbi:MAG: hypothetical protein A3K19_11780 [Lentisphaerae bacterium RIFOXYB12_FULL_65_16]|nr:MAG: hypothetical protein A3K18_23250 [Lentisphaerae bacterium RIFOXYA12_64_32]OGV87991.1 MAG: hypothetical protein A3K19_11780 [Lentisphaerae bacterium RIFOXYB12_FULL_65_16]